MSKNAFDVCPHAIFDNLENQVSLLQNIQIFSTYFGTWWNPAICATFHRWRKKSNNSQGVFDEKKIIILFDHWRPLWKVMDATLFRHVTMSTKELRTSRGMSPKPLMEYMLPTLSGSRLVPLPVSWGCCDDFCPGSLIPTSHKVTVTRKLQKTMDPSKIESDLTYGPRSASCVSC